MPTSYLRPCKYCGQLIRMAEVPSGTWQPFDAHGDRRHDCSSTSEVSQNWSLSNLGHQLTCKIECWWCSDEVFFHTNGNGDSVLFDELGWPWTLHSCWDEHVDERQRAVENLEGDLRSRGYDGRGKLINVSHSSAPDSIPLKGQRNPPDLQIRLLSDDHQIVDSTAGQIVRFISEHHYRDPIAYPLPVQSTEKEEEGDAFTRNVHYRVIDVWKAGPDLIAELTQLQLSEAVEISIRQS